MAWYETPRDRALTHDVLMRLNAREMPAGAPYDGVLDHPRMIQPCLVEVKARNMHWGQYPDIVLSKEKADQILVEAREIGAKAMFIVRTTDNPPQHWACNLRRVATARVRKEGRTHAVRRAKDHDEDVYMLPVGWFVRVLD